jgi:hypothetical protein
MGILIGISLLVSTASCEAEVQPMQKGEDGSCIEDSQVIYERYYSNLDKWCIGVDVVNMDAGFHVGTDSKFEGPVRHGINSPLGHTTLGCGFGNNEKSIALFVERQANVTTDNNPAVVFTDRADGYGHAVSVNKVGGNGRALEVTRTTGTEATVYFDTRGTVANGRTVHMTHRGPSIGMTLQNDYLACPDSSGDMVDCITPGGHRNSEAVSFPAGELLELRCASDNQCVDMFIANNGIGFGIAAADVPGAVAPIFYLDNWGNREFLSFVDSTTGVAHFRISKELIQGVAGMRLFLGMTSESGHAEEQLHVEDNALIEGDLIVDGYIQNPETTGMPPIADCSATEHNGRQKWDGLTRTMWVCDGYSGEWAYLSYSNY